MNVAEVRYTGRQRSSTVKVPRGGRYRFRRNASEPWVSVDDIDDARWLNEQLNVEVRWTPYGMLRGKFGSVEAVLAEQYREKRSIAKDLGIDFDGNPDEETLDESIEEHISDLRERGEL